jgi:hypothetical protein
MPLKSRALKEDFVKEKRGIFRLMKKMFLKNQDLQQSVKKSISPEEFEELLMIFKSCKTLFINKNCHKSTSIKEEKVS